VIIQGATSAIGAYTSRQTKTQSHSSGQARASDILGQADDLFDVFCELGSLMVVKVFTNTDGEPDSDQIGTAP